MEGDEFNLHDSITVGCQLRTFAKIESQVKHAVIEGIRPVIEIDLDLCALRPIYRTRQALERVGQQFGIAEFSKPNLLNTLPGYSDEAWTAFVQLHHLEDLYPKLFWFEDHRPTRRMDSPFGLFHQLFWTAEWMFEDEPTAGLGAFVHVIESLGGCCVFLSGRWQEEQYDPSIESLKRAGIPSPNLVIGNPWHETKASTHQNALTDSAVKSWRQSDVLKNFGTPIAIIDDRPSNRRAVASKNCKPMLSVAIAIPGFTCDPINVSCPLRISTFESFKQTIDAPPQRQLMKSRYPMLGYGSGWAGEYAGIGGNGLPYCIPRPHPSPVKGEKPPFKSVLGFAKRGMTEEESIEIFETTIPSRDLATLHEAYETARELATTGVAAPWAGTSGADANFEESIWRNLVCAWLHSRDMEFLMNCLGFPCSLAGIHDLREEVNCEEIKKLILSKNPIDFERILQANYSEWLTKWASELTTDTVNVGFLNPHLLVDLCLWTPSRRGSQNAMDVHRLSEHHNGDGGERYDPIEEGINNLLHLREGRYGIRKEPITSWRELRSFAQTETGSTDMAKNSAARKVLHTAVEIAETLESSGWLTPWFLCEVED